MLFTNILLVQVSSIGEGGLAVMFMRLLFHLFYTRFNGFIGPMRKCKDKTCNI